MRVFHSGHSMEVIQFCLYPVWVGFHTVEKSESSDKRKGLARYALTTASSILNCFSRPLEKYGSSLGLIIGYEQQTLSKFSRKIV